MAASPPAAVYHPLPTQVTPESLELHYWSSRKADTIGMPPGVWVVGFIEAVAEEMYGKQRKCREVWI